MTAAATRPIAIKIDQDTRDRVKRLAEARHRTSHWVMREALANTLSARKSAKRSGGMPSMHGTSIGRPVCM